MQLTAAAVTPPAEHAARWPAGAADAAAADAGVRPISIEERNRAQCSYWRMGNMKLKSMVSLATIVSCVAALALPWPAMSQAICVVTRVGTNADTITVRVSPPSVPICGQPQECSFGEFYNLYVTPCPLNETCAGDTYGEILMCRTAYMELSFLAGASYILWGNYTYMGYFTDFHEPCNQNCRITGNIGQSVFPDDYVATSKSTWGSIKSLYSSQ